MKIEIEPTTTVLEVDGRPAARIWKGTAGTARVRLLVMSIAVDGTSPGAKEVDARLGSELIELEDPSFVLELMLHGFVVKDDVSGPT